MPNNPYKTITELGATYGIAEPYENYGALVAKCIVAAQEREGYEWMVFFRPEDISLLPDCIDALKSAEDKMADLGFEAEPYLGVTPIDIRGRCDLLALTMAQFLDAFARGEDVLPDVGHQGMYFAFEQCGGNDPFIYWRLSSRKVFAGWDRLYFHGNDFAVRAAVLSDR